VITTALPPPALLGAAPQLAALAILDAALLTAEEVLIAQHPDVDFDGDLDGRTPTDATFLAPVLVARFDELHMLLERYDAAVKAALLAPDDFPF
jgi:hypothetical protein